MNSDGWVITVWALAFFMFAGFCVHSCNESAVAMQQAKAAQKCP